MFFSIITKNLYWKIWTENLLSKYNIGVNNEKIQYYESSLQKNLIFRGEVGGGNKNYM